MKNISKVIWTEEANKNLSNVIKYLDENWTKREIEKFLKKLNKHISIIQSRKTKRAKIFQPHRQPNQKLIVLLPDQSKQYRQNEFI